MNYLWIFNAVLWAIIAILELWLYNWKFKSRTIRAILLVFLFVLLAVKEN